MTPEQYLLASAYLDGELTDEERRLAEADPAVMAEVDELRALHIELIDVESPTADARESAIAAAMAAFSTATGVDDAVLPAAPASPAPVVPFRPRPVYARYLGIAAAVVGVGLLGTVIVTSGRGGDDDAATDAGAELAEAPSADRSMVENVTAATDAPAAAAPADEPADEVMADDGDAGDTAADVAEATDAPAYSADADAPDDTAAAEAVPTDPSLPTADALITYAEDLIARRDAGTLGATPNTRCTVPEAPYAFVLERAELETELGSVDLFLAIDDTTRMVYGIDPESCDVLVDAPLP